MQNILSGFAALHQFAAKRGDGLHPDLLEFALRGQKLAQQGVVTLDVQSTASGPAHKIRATEAHDADNVTVLPTAAQPSLSEKTG